MTPDFREKILLVLADKLVLAILLVAVGLVANRALERFKADLGLKSTRRNLVLQAQIQFRERQIAEFYGPIYALLKRIRPLDDLWSEGRVDGVEAKVIAAIRDANDRVVELILSKSHLIEGAAIPESYTRFLTHVAIWHAFRDSDGKNWSEFRKLPEAHYDVRFEEEISSTTEALKLRLHELYQEYDIRDLAPTAVLRRPLSSQSAVAPTVQRPDQSRP